MRETSDNIAITQNFSESWEYISYVLWPRIWQIFWSRNIEGLAYLTFAMLGSQLPCITFSFDNIVSVLEARSSFVSLFVCLFVCIMLFYCFLFLFFLLRVVCLLVGQWLASYLWGKHKNKDLQVTSCSLSRMVEIEWCRSWWEQIYHCHQKTFY